MSARTARIPALLVVFLLAAATGGCATMFSGTTQPLSIRSEPPGAQVIMNGSYVGVTPLHMEVARDKNLNVLLRSPGYPDKALLLRRDFNPVAVLNLVSIVCWAIDIATGAMFRFDPESLLVPMDPGAPLVPGQVYPPPVYQPPGGPLPGGPPAGMPPAMPPPYPGPPPAYAPPPAAPAPPPAAPAPASPPGATPPLPPPVAPPLPPPVAPTPTPPGAAPPH